MLELRRSASRIRTVTPLVERKSVEQLADRLRRGDDVAALGATLDGDPHALVESTDPDLRAWVADRIDEFRAGAVPLEEYSREDGRV